MAALGWNFFGAAMEFKPSLAAAKVHEIGVLHAPSPTNVTTKPFSVCAFPNGLEIGENPGCSASVSVNGVDGRSNARIPSTSLCAKVRKMGAANHPAHDARSVLDGFAVTELDVRRAEKHQRPPSSCTPIPKTTRGCVDDLKQQRPSPPASCRSCAGCVRFITTASARDRFDVARRELHAQIDVSCLIPTYQRAFEYN